MFSVGGYMAVWVWRIMAVGSSIRACKARGLEESSFMHDGSMGEYLHGIYLPVLRISSLSLRRE
jgi:hypothetical protein